MTRDHGGGVDAAVAQFGGTKDGWVDLSTGINPCPYPIENIPATAWSALPDDVAQHAVITAARAFWNIPDSVAVLAAPGASALIARIPSLRPSGTVQIAGPTYNEHAAAFATNGWQVTDSPASARVIVHPNNPTGHLWNTPNIHELLVIDESFCDVTPDHSLIELAAQKNTIILKSFGKFWGLAGLRLGFAIGDPILLNRLANTLGPWPVSGPALHVGAQALADRGWAKDSRARLTSDSERLDTLMESHNARSLGGTSLFRLYEVDSAADWQTRLAQGHVWSRIFPYSKTWLRLGLPAPHQWDQLKATL